VKVEGVERGNSPRGIASNENRHSVCRGATIGSVKKITITKKRRQSSRKAKAEMSKREAEEFRKRVTTKKRGVVSKG